MPRRLCCAPRATIVLLARRRARSCSVPLVTTAPLAPVRRTCVLEGSCALCYRYLLYSISISVCFIVALTSFGCWHQTSNSNPLCTSGKYCPAGSSVDGPSCSAGFYCPQGSSAPVPCTGGYGCDQAGLASVDTVNKKCQAGYYCPAGSSSRTQVLCPPGYICALQSSAPQACAAQTVCPTGGMVTALTCPAGYYCATSGLSSPTGACTAGYYCTAGSLSATQNGCTSGNYCPSGSDQMTACPVGFVLVFVCVFVVIAICID
jgi:hypothetical protein